MLLSEAKKLKPGDRLKSFNVVDAENNPTIWIVTHTPEVFWYNPLAVRVCVKQECMGRGGTKYTCVFNQRDLAGVIGIKDG